jgi:hypothetical protein
MWSCDRLRWELAHGNQANLENHCERKGDRGTTLPVTFVCADERLIAIAQAEGLLTNNPNHHP